MSGSGTGTGPGHARLCQRTARECKVYCPCDTANDERRAIIERRTIGYAIRRIPAADEGMEMEPTPRALTIRGARRKAKRWSEGGRDEARADSVPTP